MNFPDTIFALSSGSLPSAIAVVRLSGPRVRFAFETILGRVPLPRRASYDAFLMADGSVLDRGLALYLAGPGSATGEDCGEFHVHGGRAVVSALLEELGRLPGLRHAAAGEFTRRAFLNGRLDLTEVEGLADLIASETEAQRRLAVAQSGGRERAVYEAWRSAILQLRSQIEADLDFSDQEDASGLDMTTVRDGATALAFEMAGHCARFRQAEIVRHGFRVVLMGAPNSGKSTLINALARRDVAIVSDEAGTTRDAIEVQLDVDGHKVVVVDTAGIRDATGLVERIGIARAMKAADDADLVLMLADLTEPLTIEAPAGRRVLWVGTKVDLAGDVTSGFDMIVSAVSGEGLEALLRVVGDAARAAAGDMADPMPFRSRHVALLEACRAHLDAASRLQDAELVAEELRLAGEQLGLLTGRIGTEDVLGEIFSKFCIGK